MHDSPTSFNGVGEAASACEAHLSHHKSISKIASQLAASGYPRSVTSVSADADLLSVASTHSTAVAELAVAQLDRQVVSLRSNTRKSDDLSGAGVIVTNHRAALDLRGVGTRDEAVVTQRGDGLIIPKPRGKITV